MNREWLKNNRAILIQYSFGIALVFIAILAGIGLGKDLIGIISTVLNTIVLVVGGIFAYFKFVKERPLERRANISQEILSKRFNDKFTLIHAQVTIDNAGTAALPVYQGYTCVAQV
jgi:hypothetical protein